MVKKRPKIGLALSGGGARGGVHIGVLKVLRQSGIPIDVVTGCSAGAIVGACFAAGSLNQLEEFVIDVTKKDVLKLFPPTRSKFYLFDDSNIIPFFEKFVGQRSFADLEIRLGLVAADVRTRRWITLEAGSISQALRASTSVPCLFKPVELDGHLLVDGGLISYLPVQAARQLGADLVIGVDVFSGVGSPTRVARFASYRVGEIRRFLEKLKQEAQRPFENSQNLGKTLDFLRGLARRVNGSGRVEKGKETLNVVKLALLCAEILDEVDPTLQEERQAADIIIRPRVKGISTVAFERIPQAIIRGEIAARKALPGIRRRILQR